jgi:hypothetical protein
MSVKDSVLSIVRSRRSAPIFFKSSEYEFSSFLSDTNSRARYRRYLQWFKCREIHQAPVHNESSNINRSNCPTSRKKSSAPIWATILRRKFPGLFRFQQTNPSIGVLDSSQRTVLCFVDHTHRDNSAMCQYDPQANQNNYAPVL